MSERRDRRVQRRRTRRSARRARRKIATSQAFNGFLRLTLGNYLVRAFNMRAENSELFRRIRRPFLILPNHSCVLDPFMINNYVPAQIQYVVSDANFRSPLVNFGLSLVGAIPKTKVMSDMDSIRNIMRVRDRGGVIGIYPEGQNTWDGHTLPMYLSTAKLAKLLKIPVVTALVRGAFLSLPRWAKRRRRGEVSIRFDLAFHPDELRSASADQIDTRIGELITHDEYDYNRRAGIRFIGRDRAEYAEKALFICPACREIGSLRSEGNLFGCTKCGYQVHFGLYGFLRSSRGELRFDNMHEWNRWQGEELSRIMARRSPSDPSPLWSEPDARIQIGYRDLPLSPYATGGIDLHLDRIVIRPRKGEPEEIPLTTIAGVNVQNNERLEFYAGSDLLRVTLADREVHLKWDMALRALLGTSAHRQAAIAT